MIPFSSRSSRFSSKSTYALPWPAGQTVLALFLVLSTSALLTCGKDSPTTPTTPTPTPQPDPPKATKITIAPATLTPLVTAGQTVQLTATVKDQNNSTMTGVSVSWKSSNVQGATVNVSGLVTAVGNGTATITAATGTVTGTVQVSVEIPAVPTAITIAPSEPDTLTAVGQTLRLVATVKDQHGETMTGVSISWESSDSQMATVSATGLVTSVANGTAKITATTGDVSTAVTVIVAQEVHGIAITPPSPKVVIATGNTEQLSATVLDSEETPVSGAVPTWSSSDEAVATVDSNGLVTAVGVGQAEITATYEEYTAEKLAIVRESLDSTGMVRVLYLVPSDVAFRDDYSDAIATAVVNAQDWYRQQLDGFTFSLYDDVPELCRLPENTDHYALGGAWDKVLQDVQQCAPVRWTTEQSEFVWILYVDVKEACEVMPRQLGRGGGGITMIPGNDLEGLTNSAEGWYWYEYFPGDGPCSNERYYVHYGRWVGGLAHELGHALGDLPHPPGCDEGLSTCDSEALMWLGYVPYPATYLRSDDKRLLLSSPFIGRN